MFRSILVVTLVLFSIFAKAEIITYAYEGDIVRISNDTTQGALAIGDKITATLTYESEDLHALRYRRFTNQDSSFQLKSKIILNIEKHNYSVSIEDKAHVFIFNESPSPLISAKKLSDSFSVRTDFLDRDYDYLKSLSQPINGQFFLGLSLSGLDREGLAIDTANFRENEIFGNTSEWETRVLQFYMGTADKENLKNSNWGIYSTRTSKFERIN